MAATRDYHTKKSKSERQIPYDMTYMWDLKYDTNEFIYKTETVSWIQRTNLWLSSGRRWGKGRIGSSGLVYANYYT